MSERTLHLGVLRLKKDVKEAETHAKGEYFIQDVMNPLQFFATGEIMQLLLQSVIFLDETEVETRMDDIISLTEDAYGIMLVKLSDQGDVTTSIEHEEMISDIENASTLSPNSIASHLLPPPAPPDTTRKSSRKRQRVWNDDFISY